jgi:hypothetical protein
MLHLAEEVPGRTVHHILRDGLIDGLVISSVRWVGRGSTSCSTRRCPPC